MIVLYTDFGVADPYVGQLHAVLAREAPGVAIVDLLQREIAAIVAQPDVGERLTKLGFKAVANTPDQFGERIGIEMDKWAKVVRDAKLRIE